MSLNLIAGGYQAKKTQCYIPVACGENRVKDMTYFYGLLYIVINML